MQIGAESAAQAEQQMPILRDGAVESYVNGDGVIDKADLAALFAIVHPRVRAARPGH